MTDHVEGLFDALSAALEEEREPQAVLREVLAAQRSGVRTAESRQAGEQAPGETVPATGETGAGETTPLKRETGEGALWTASRSRAVQQAQAQTRTAAVLLHQVRAAGRMAGQIPGVSQIRGEGERHGTLPVRPAARSGLDLRGVDRAFQRDSRRYDNGFTLY